MNNIKISQDEMAVLSAIGRRYGSAGGKKSSANMTPEQRRERALKANAASQESKRLKRLAREGGE